MAHFEQDALEWLRTTKEVTIRTAKHPDTAVIIWAVVAADSVYVRSVRGERGRWYRDLVSDGRATVRVNDRSIQVQAIPAADDASVAQCSEAFQVKYRGSAHVGSIVRAEVLSTTLRLEPVPDRAA